VFFNTKVAEYGEDFSWEALGHVYEEKVVDSPRRKEYAAARCLARESDMSVVHWQ
jgi:hypothetical protein